MADFVKYRVMMINLFFDRNQTNITFEWIKNTHIVRFTKSNTKIVESEINNSIF